MFSLQIQMDSENAQVRLEQMIKDIEDTATVAMPVEFVAWQEQDMKRDNANIEIQGWSVLTSIWPTSRKKMVARKRRKFEPKRVLRGLRPILRPEMFEMLRVRMNAMMSKYVTWRT
jgi:hypothetical protein